MFVELDGVLFNDAVRIDPVGEVEHGHAGSLEHLDVAPDHLVHLAVFRSRTEEAAQNTDPQQSRLDPAGHPDRPVPVPVGSGRGGGVLGIVSGDRMQHDDRILHCQGEHAGGVLRQGVGEQPAPADKPDGRAEADHRARGRRGTDGVHRSGAEGDDAETRCHAGRGPAARPSGCPRQVVGIPRLPTQSAHGFTGGRQLVQIRLREHDRPRFLQFSNDEGVEPGTIVPEQHRPVRRRHLRLAHVVLQQHRNPVERPADSRCLPLPVQPVGMRERIRVRADHRVDGRTLPVVPIDPLETGLDERPAGELSLPHGSMDIPDRRNVAHAAPPCFQRRQSMCDPPLMSISSPVM